MLVSSDGAHAPFAVKLNFGVTTNVNEYEAYTIGFEMAQGLGARGVEIFGDSNFIISPTRRGWKVNEEKPNPYHEFLEKLQAKFEKITFFYLPRDEN